PPHRSSTLFPYTTLFRSRNQACERCTGPRRPARWSAGTFVWLPLLPPCMSVLVIWGRCRHAGFGRDLALTFESGCAQNGIDSVRSEEHTSELQSLRHLVC